MIAAPSPPLHFAQVLLPSNQGSACVPFIFMPHNCVGYACDREVFPLLERHYRWLRGTQAGPSATSFRWRGCTKDHSFASGLDDYPRGVVSACRGRAGSQCALRLGVRGGGKLVAQWWWGRPVHQLCFRRLVVAQAPTDDDEHVDLLSWIALVSREGARTRPVRYRSCRNHVTLWETGLCVFMLQASLCSLLCVGYQAARLLSRLASHVGDSGKAASFASEASTLVAALDRHWSSQYHVFCDIGLAPAPPGIRAVCLIFLRASVCNVHLEYM